MGFIHDGIAGAQEKRRPLARLALRWRK
jgi:hypothetical protein